MYLHGINFDELPLLILGSASFTSAPLGLWSPEILGVALVGSFEELGILGKNSKPLFNCLSQKQFRYNEQIAIPEDILTLFTSKMNSTQLLPGQGRFNCWAK